MRTVIDTDGILIVTHFEWFWLLLGAGLELTALSSATYQHLHGEPVAAAIAYGMFGLATVLGVEWSRFEFRPASRLVMWERRTMFRRTGGVIAFGDITSIVLGSAASCDMTDGSSTARRLTLHTRSTVIPVTSSATARRAPIRAAAAAIQAVIGAAIPAKDRPPVLE